MAGLAHRNYQRWRSVQDEIFRTLVSASTRGRGDPEEENVADPVAPATRA
jgi:hypothetical protein